MRERDLKALEFDKVMTLVMGMAASEPAREVLSRVRPAIDTETVRDRLRATAEMAELRPHTGSIPMQEFADLRGLFLAAAREGAILDGESLVKIRDFVLSSRHVAKLHAFARRAVSACRRDRGQSSRAQGTRRRDAEGAGRRRATARRCEPAAQAPAQSPARRTRRPRSAPAALAQSPGMEAFVSDYIVTVRNQRFVLPLKLNYTERLEGIVQDRSVSGETLFVEPMWAVELNNRLMMLEREVEAEEHRILMQLSAMVRGYSNELQLTFDAMVALDALNARAIFAERFECSEPEISERRDRTARSAPSAADGRGARGGADRSAHPRRSERHRDFGPQHRRQNRRAQDARPVCLDGAGRSSDSGAARAASIAVFRSVFADIGDEQSIEASLSTFSAHIANLSEIVRSLEEPALVILDEPGAGTDPAEGAALAIGLMNYLAARRCLVAVATHSTAVKLHAYSRSGFEVAAVDFDPERLAPLYRLKPHTIGQSYGLAVARRLGLPEEIIKGAQAAMGESTIELETAIERLEQQRASLEEEIARARERSSEFGGAPARGGRGRGTHARALRARTQAASRRGHRPDDGFPPRGRRTPERDSQRHQIAARPQRNSRRASPKDSRLRRQFLAMRNPTPTSRHSKWEIRSNSAASAASWW